MGKSYSRLSTPTLVMAALLSSGAECSCKGSAVGGQNAGKAPSREFDAGWMTLRAPPGWDVESQLDGTGCPLAHVKVSQASGAYVTFSLDAFCGGEGFYGLWKIDWREDGRLVVLDSPPPSDCGIGFEPPPCGAPSYWIGGAVTPSEGRGGRSLSVLLGNTKQRQPSDLPILRAVIESARIRNDKLPPPWNP